MGTATADPQPKQRDPLNIRWLGRLLSSSIGRKFVMGLTGLLLCGFLVGHLAGNFLLFSGPEGFNAYAAWLHANELLPIIEVALLLLFLAHIYLGIVTTIENRSRRQQRYAMKRSKRDDIVLPVPAHNWMFISGALVLGFLILHLVDLRFALRPGIDYKEAESVYWITVSVLSNPISRVVYIIGSIILGFHLAHGFSSAFQSLGLNHPKYMKLVKAFGVLFAIVIAVGFASLPLLVPSWGENRNGPPPPSASADQAPH